MTRHQQAMCVLAIAHFAQVLAFMLPATSHTTLRPRESSSTTARGACVWSTVASQRLVAAQPLRISRRRRGELAAYLGGGGPGGNRGGEIFGISYTTIALGLALILFPGVFFGALNALFLLVTLGPVVLIIAVNIFIKANTRLMVQHTLRCRDCCAVCGSTVTGPKEGLTQCFSCGSVLAAVNGKFEVESSIFGGDEDSMSSPFGRDSSRGGASSRGSGAGQIIDVDAIDVTDD
ncbi:hypothetical protein JKP88DRAFT_323824 [Tribonema minus]|uniref:Uncharacterized protein n=1 Tax=Tribonema minus TaxID=303371 RepID=A0A836CC93_9STRA|nr:hypothetical protein JKP88DRAFT_323824 [Tribonema minus]